MQSALGRFREYRNRADDMERRVRAWRSSRGLLRRAHAYVLAIDDAALDEGWREVALVAEGYDEDVAELLAGHYLFGEDWADMAATHGLGYDMVKKRCYRALEWLDAREGGEG